MSVDTTESSELLENEDDIDLGLICTTSPNEADDGAESSSIPSATMPSVIDASSVVVNDANVVVAVGVGVAKRAALLVLVIYSSFSSSSGAKGDSSSGGDDDDDDVTGSAHSRVVGGTIRRRVEVE